MEQKKRVLIADNTEGFCHALTQVLAKSGDYEVVGTANDGEQTIKLIKQLTPDVLVLDLMLPKKDGIAVLKEIYNMENRPTVIATSGFITDYVASASATLGVRYLMLKPCDLDALVERIQELGQNSPKAKRTEPTDQQKIENLTTSILRDIGVLAHIKGYQYLREAIMIAVEDMDVINALTKVLYPQVARIFQTTPTRVARAIQHAIEISWDRREQNALDRFFGLTVSMRKDRPSVAEFLALVADDIQRTIRTP